MKPLTIKVGTLAKIGLGVATAELIFDLGKATMLKAVKSVNSETADEVMKALDYGINSKDYHGLRKLKIKIVRGAYKELTEK